MFIFPNRVWDSLLMCPWIPIPVEKDRISFSEHHQNSSASTRTDERTEGNSSRKDWRRIPPRNLLEECATLLTKSESEPSECVSSVLQGRWIGLQDPLVEAVGDQKCVGKEIHPSKEVNGTLNHFNTSDSDGQLLMLKLCGERGSGVGALLTHIPSVEESSGTNSPFNSSGSGTETTAFWWCYETEESLKEQLKNNYPSLHIPIDRILQRINLLVEKEAVFRSSGFWPTSKVDPSRVFDNEQSFDKKGGISLYRSSSSMDGKSLLPLSDAVFNGPNLGAKSSSGLRTQILNPEESVTKRKRGRDESCIVPDKTLHEMINKGENSSGGDLGAQDFSSWLIECTLPIEVWKGSVVHLTLKLNCRPARWENIDGLAQNNNVEILSNENLSTQELYADLLKLKLEREVLYKPLRAAILSLSEALLSQGRSNVGGLVLPQRENDEREIPLTASSYLSPLSTFSKSSLNQHPSFGSVGKNVELLGQTILDQFLEHRSDEIVEVLTKEGADCPTVAAGHVDCNCAPNLFLSTMALEIKKQQNALENLMQGTLFQLPHPALYSFHNQCTSSILQFSRLSVDSYAAPASSLVASDSAFQNHSSLCSNQRLISEIQNRVDGKCTRQRLEKMMMNCQGRSRRSWRRPQGYPKGSLQEGLSRSSSASPAPFTSTSPSHSGDFNQHPSQNSTSSFNEVDGLQPLTGPLANPEQRQNRVHGSEQVKNFNKTEKTYGKNNGTQDVIHEAVKYNSDEKNIVSEKLCSKEDLGKPLSYDPVTAPGGVIPSASFSSSDQGGGTKGKKPSVTAVPPTRRNLFL